MGDTLRREFSLEPVDTGRREPQPPTTTPPFVPGGIPATGNLSPQPAAPITRPSFLQSFLANLGPALAYGTAAQPGMPFGTGLSGALQGIEEQKRYNAQQAEQRQARQFQQQYQMQTQARESALAQSTLESQAATRAQQAAQEGRTEQLFPLELQQGQLQADLLGANAAFYKDPANLTSAVQDATKSLGPLSSPEQAQIDAATKDARINRKFDPINAAVKTISQDRITTARGTDTTPFKAWRDQFVKQMGREPNAQEIVNFTTAGQGVRISGLENLRQDNYLNTTTGTVETMTAGDFAQANKANPGQYVKYNTQVSNALKGQALINDINAGIGQMRAAINDPNFQFSPKGRAIMEVAAKAPENAVSAVTSGLAAAKLSDAEQNFIIARATLLERAMSLRGLQGQGAGSDQQRRAIADMLVGLNTADKNMAMKQLTTLQNNVDNVASAIPKIGKRGAGGTAPGQPPPGATHIVLGPDGKNHYTNAAGTIDYGVAP